MTTYAVQYLEPDPTKLALSPEAVRDRLQAALVQLPITHVLLGWHLPAPLVRVCREITRQAGVQLYLWHPLLTGDGVLMPRPEWMTIGLGGEAVPGFQGMPEFTFVCPNRPAVQEAVLQRVEQVIAEGVYDGLFLDRIRYPSPLANPKRWLACFCEDCQRAAAATGLDLDALRHTLIRWLDASGRVPVFVQGLLAAPSASDPDLAQLEAFLDVRATSVHHIVASAADLIHAAGLGVGLDCFSPALTRAVGQDLGALMGCADWIKLMTYAHALGPAGLPFELLGLANWLVADYALDEAEALAWIARATQLPLPATRAALRAQGLPSAALRQEVQRGKAAGVHTLWAGIELVEIPGVCHLTPAQIKRDLAEIRAADADGLVLSWDLWDIPQDRLGWMDQV